MRLNSFHPDVRQILLTIGISDGPIIGDPRFVAGVDTAAYEWLKRKVPTELMHTSIADAIANATGSRGDKIIVAPYYTESIIAAAGIAVDKAGLSIIGLGKVAARPTITFATSTDGDIDIDAADVTLKNLLFLNSIDALKAPIDVNAAGFTLDACEFKSPTLTNDILNVLITDANADDLTIKNCVFRQAHAGPTECIRLVGVDRAQIIDNFIFGSFSTAAINAITTACTELLIARNSINNSVTDALAIDLVANSTGRIEYNVGSVVSTGAITDANIIDAAKCQLIGNYFSDADGETGKLIGTASA